MTAKEWLQQRTPPVPGDFGRWMEPRSPEGPASPGALADEAAAALDAAASGADRPRAGAFDLLAADGFLTYACEAALEADEPDTALLELVRRFAG